MGNNNMKQNAGMIKNQTVDQKLMQIFKRFENCGIRSGRYIHLFGVGPSWVAMYNDKVMIAYHARVEPPSSRSDEVFYNEANYTDFTLADCDALERDLEEQYGEL